MNAAELLAHLYYMQRDLHIDLETVEVQVRIANHQTETLDLRAVKDVDNDSVSLTLAC